MTGSARVYWDDALTGYDFGPSHPMNPVRLDLTMRLARALGVLDGIELVSPKPATTAELLRVHTPEFVSAVQQCSGTDSEGSHAHGIGTPDVPTFADMHEITSLIAGATLGAATAVWSGDASHAFSPAGGLHHAMPDAAAGFCVYNDVAVASAGLLDAGAQRVAYVDVDVHHGDGVQATFWDDPRVLTISIHEDPRTLYPGTGRAREIGGPAAEGSAVNLALPASTGDGGWLRAIHSVVPQLLEAFAPQVLVTQHGCDTHRLDPLAHLELSIDGQRMAAEALHRWAHEYADGRWVATGGGGYAIADVVPRIWSLVMAELAGHPIPPQTPVPEEWRRYVQQLTGTRPPDRMTDGAAPVVTDWASGYHPEDAMDQDILATRRAVFPHHGLDPDRD
ncbi:MAG: acetoin utilization protein AcuC [Actinomycetia bacterium]|nr:acetoin utilization protein AcuC [Actinomycetes bacterium]